MKEIEVKVLDIDRKKIENKLRKLGAKKTFEGITYGIFYDFTDKRLLKSEKFLRLRKQCNKYSFTFKSRLSRTKAKVMRELEVDVDNFKTMHEILINLGLKIRAKHSKKRISYNLGNLHFELDKNLGIPWYLEIEAPNLREIYSACERLGIDKKELKPWGTPKVYRYYGKVNN